MLEAWNAQFIVELIKERIEKGILKERMIKVLRMDQSVKSFGATPLILP